MTDDLDGSFAFLLLGRDSGARTADVCCGPALPALTVASLVVLVVRGGAGMNKEAQSRIDGCKPHCRQRIQICCVPNITQRPLEWENSGLCHCCCLHSLLITVVLTFYLDV